MTARYCKQDFFEFDPSHKLFLATNAKPRIRGTDAGIWRRVRPIEFSRRFWTDEIRITEPNQVYRDEDRADPKLKDALKAEAEGIHADMVRFAKTYYAGNGSITPPAGVSIANARYRKDEDNLGRFFSHAVEATSKADVQAERMRGKELREAYVEWSANNGYSDQQLVGGRKFGERAKDLLPWAEISGVMVYWCRKRPYDPDAVGGSGEGQTSAHPTTAGSAGSQSSHVPHVNSPHPPRQITGPSADKHKAAGAKKSFSSDDGKGDLP